MKKGKRQKPEQIIKKLRETERLIAGGLTVSEAVRRIDVSENTYYRWRSKYQNCDKPEIRRLRDLQKENERLKRLVADLSLDNQILKEATEGNF